MKVSWDDYSQYMEKKNMFQTTNQFILFKKKGQHVLSCSFVMFINKHIWLVRKNNNIMILT